MLGVGRSLSNGSASEIQAAPKRTAALDLTHIRAYPNPFKPGSGGDYDSDKINFDGLTQDAHIAVYTLAGEKVVDLNKNDESDLLEWDARNSNGEPVAGGVYVYKITNSKGEKRSGRVAIVR